ncbi:MAG: hypothetical protein ACQKBU_04135, partial [Verrucomicrobiales bacterium]
LPRNNFSDPFELADGEVTLSFLPDFLGEDEKLPAGCPRLKIPEDWQKVVILAFPNPKNSVFPVQFKAFDASGNQFGSGDLLFINFSRSNVFGTIGSKKLQLGKGETKVVRAPTAQQGDYKVKLDVIPEATGNRQRFLRQTWRHDPKRRQVVMVLPQAPPRQVSYYAASISDW